MKKIKNLFVKHVTSQSILRLLMVLLILPMAFVNAWGGGSSYVKTETAAPAEGLVYCNKSKNVTPSDSDYKRYYPGGSGTGSSNTSCYVNLGAAKSGVYIYCWAKPARGYEFDHWDGYEKGYLPYGDQNKSKLLDVDSWNGVNDQMVGTCGNGASTYKQHQAYFKPVTPFAITYTPPVGGSYHVAYSYLKTRETTGGEYEFYTATEEYDMTADLEENQVVTSYAADEITLSTTATNFIGWYEGDTKLSESKTYAYTAHANVTIKAEFKEIGWGDVSGDLTVNATAKETYSGKKVYIACPTLIGTWADADFTITTTTLSNTYGSIAFGSATLDKTNNRLEIPYSYTATNWGGISVDVTVTPAYGEAKQFTIACSAEEVVAYEACIEESGERTHTGTLAAMMVQANSMDNKPTLKLMNPITITSPLSVTRSFTFDVNGKVLTANCASAFSIDAAGVDVKIIDGSFTQVGEIHTSYASADPVSVVTFTKAAKLTMLGGTLSAENTGAGAAYGVDVQHGSEDVEKGSIFYMTGGDLTVTVTTGNAQGAHVASTIDYATFNGGSMTVSAPTNAYGIWSAGQSNITNAAITVNTTGANAYGVYVDGATTTVTTTDFAVNSNTTNAYGAHVNSGRLNFNSGKLMVEAVASNVYGVHVEEGAIAMLQQNAIVKAEATGASGTNVVGINNLGTASLNNITVTATSPTNNAKAINTAASAISTTIEDGSYTANAETGSAYGLHHQNGKLEADGATFKGIVKTSGTEAYGVCAAADAKIKNATLLGETRGSGSTAYGFKGDAVGAIDTLSNCTVTGLSNKSKAYAIYTKADVAAINCTLTATTLGSNNANDGAEAYGMYAENGTNALTNCNAIVSVNTISSYGAYHKAGSLSIIGGVYNVEAKQATATAAQNTMLYGLYNEAGMITTVTGAAFNVTATNASYAQNVYGAYINGILNSTGATYNVTACRYVYGLQGMGSSNLVLNNNTIRVEATNTNTTSGNSSYCYGIAAKKNFSINGDKVDAIGNIRDVYAMFFDASTSDGHVLGGKFSAKGNGTNGYGALNAAGTIGKVKLKGGVYKSAINLAKYAFTDYEVYNMDGSYPDYADGYRYVIAKENPSPYVCRIVGGAYYATLKEALQYTLDNSGNYTIVMTQPHTLPAGEYTLPANATLVIPYKFDQNAITVQGSNPANPDTRISAGLVENFLCLTIADGVHLNVNGKIGVGGEVFCQENNKSSYINGPYGRIHMEEGSLIQLNSGSYLYAWGMITGNGNIIVKNNAEVHEMFQVGDMKSASNLANYYNNNSEKFFPITQYSIQNIEVPTTYYYNSRLIGALLCYYPGVGGVYYGEKNVKLVGTENALFEITTEDETTWVRKSYKNARQVWDINSSAKLGSISITVSVSGLSSSFNSANYILPITYNMDMHVLSGDFEITHNAELLPGSTIEIDKTASLTIKEDQKLYVFDKDQWPFSSSYDDAAINVHGNINVEGSLYTSNKGSETSKTDGANIYSNNADAGTIAFLSDAPDETTTIDLITGISNGKVKKTVTMDPAQLKNGIGASRTFTPTINAEEGHAFAYVNNEWQETYTNGCFEVIGSTVYAKPSGYVALKKTQEVGGLLEGVAETNHTYLTADDKTLILSLNCQWWEVTETETAGVYYCATNGIYYHWVPDMIEVEPDVWEDQGIWEEYTVNVTFYSDEEGTTPLKVITTNYGGVPDQAVIASNPTKVTTDAATYQFKGWKSSVSGTEYPWTATLEAATTDMSYRPVFTETPRNYTVTFKNANNGADMPVETAYNTHPVCTPAPAKEATAQYTYYFQYWLASDNTTQYAIDAELPVVTGATYYTAVWAQTVNKYTVTWKNGDDILETDTKQEYGTAVSYDGINPTKETDNDFAYTFDGWSLTDGGDKLASLPTVNGEMTFYAHYSTTPRYAITFANFDGTQLQKESVTAGEHPVYNGLTPGRARDLDGYFRFIGWKNSAGTDFAPSDELPAVTGKETYTAQYDYVTELYWIHLNNIDGVGGTWSGKFGVGSTPFYAPDPLNPDNAVEPAKESTAQYEYPFTGWNPALEPVSGEATYTAQFGQNTRTYKITFANVDGNGASREVTVEYGQTPVCPVTPTKVVDHRTYAFEGWNTSIVAVAGAATYTAQFSTTGVLETFPITFDPDNGEAPVVVDVEYGEIPIYPYVNPTKAADAANTYTFSGWTPTIVAVTGPAEYTAQYTPTIRTYTIRFEDWDGTPLSTTTVSYGVTPVAPANPSRDVDLVNLKNYTFTGWSPAITTASADAVYTATYNEQNIVATVTTSSNETTYHSTWTDAKNKANQNSGCTLKLYANVIVDNNTGITKTMTIDLNGCVMSCETSTTSNQRMLDIETANVALTIIDSNPLGGGKISYKGTGTKDYRALYAKGSTISITINSGTVECISTNTGNGASAYAVYLSDKAKFYMNGGELIATSATKAYAEGGNYNMQDGTKYATITGGKMRASVNGSYTDDNAYMFSYVNYVTASGGYYTKDPGNITISSGYEKRSVGDSEPEKAEGYTHKVVRVYTVTWLNDDNSEISHATHEYGETLTPADPEKTNPGQLVYNFTGWDPAVTAVTADATYKATFELVGIDANQSDAPVVIDEVTTTEITTVRVSGQLNILEGGTLNTTNLILESNTNASGQIIGAPRLNVTGHAYFDVLFNGETGTANRTWYAIAVPWEVDAENGIFWKEGNRHLILGRDFDLVWYDGAERAAHGDSYACWKYLEDESDKMMHPGKMYMMYFGSQFKTVRFEKNAGKPIIYTSDADAVTTVATHAAQTGDNTDADWNGIANPSVCHAYLNAGTTYGQVLNNGSLDNYQHNEGSPVYSTVALSSYKFVVGKPVYVQATSNQSITVTPAISGAFLAPKRAKKSNTPEGIDAVYALHIAAEGKANADNLFVQVTEDAKENKYVIGQDLAKGGVATSSPQLWVNRYDSKLSVNTQTLIGNVAEYPLSIYAPQDGDYVINTDNADDEYALYLTQDGQVIWNLGYAPYTITMDKGVSTAYGLRIMKKSPEVTTTVEEAIFDAHGETRKVLINGQVFIIRDGNVYSIFGQKAQ